MFEHPPVTLKLGPKQPLTKEAAKLVRICNMYNDKADGSLYDDYYLQRPNERSAEVMEKIGAEIQASGAHRVEVHTEGWDELSHVLRIRLFGVKN